MADDDVWNIETCSKTEKRCCVFKDNYLFLNFIVGAITFHSFCQLKYVDVDVDVNVIFVPANLLTEQLYAIHWIVFDWVRH